MPLKRIPTDDEIAALAEQLAKLWKPGAVVRPWLRRHGDMLLELVHGDWSWTAVARAMTKAGITYRTGKAWTADWLQSEFYRARVPLKGYPRKRCEQVSASAASNGAPVAGIEKEPSRPAHLPEVSSSQEVECPSPGAVAKPEARFKPASFRPAEMRRPLTEEERVEVEQNQALTFGTPQS